MTGKQLSTVGILGSGQLAMMLAEAAANLGVRTHVFAPSHDLQRPVGDRQITGSLTDLNAVAAFAEQVDVITFETENTPVDVVAAVADRALIRPTEEAVRIAQDRLLEKRFVATAGAETAPFAVIDTADDLASAVDAVGVPSILKTRRDGYDGKGQVRITAAEELAPAWETLDRVPCVLEGFVPFDAEISVVACRSQDGTVVSFDPGLNEHRNGVLVRTTVPAPVPPAAVKAATELTGAILDALGYVGVAGIEFFVIGETVMVNEMAPRVHNSGHWTQLGCTVSQFEQHIRAITNRPLGRADRLADVAMTNLLGHDVENLDQILADGDASIVLYGKREIRPGRKMGHVNRVIT